MTVVLKFFITSPDTYRQRRRPFLGKLMLFLCSLQHFQ